VAWELHGARLLAGYNGPPGTRPWAYWVFDLGEEKPQGEWDAEALRLAELGELRPDELAELHERANEAKTRIGTRASCSARARVSTAAAWGSTSGSRRPWGGERRPPTRLAGRSCGWLSTAYSRSPIEGLCGS
jgi:hypothetical protein